MGKDRKKDKKDKKSKKDKKDRKHDKKERKHKKDKHNKKEEEEEDEWVVRTPPGVVVPPPTAATAADDQSDDFLLRTPPRASNDDAAAAAHDDDDPLAALPVHKAPSQRDDAGLSWMLRPPPRAAPRPPPERPASPPPDVPAKPKPRELNPYLADGGSGVPTEEEGTRRGRPSYMVGDGGNSWRARAERRARERAREEGTDPSAPAPTVPPESVRRDPYGSRDGGRGGASGERGGWRKRNDDNAHDDRRRESDSRRGDRDRDDRRGSANNHHDDHDDGGHVFRTRKRELPPARSEDSRRPAPSEDRMEEAESTMPPPAAPPAAAPAPRVTEEEANKIQAQLLKAEMMGDEDRIRELKGKLAQLREAQKVVVLSGLDQHGRPVNLPVSTNVDEARRMMAAEREQDARSGNLDWARSLARHQAYSDEDFGEVHFDQEGRSKKRRRTGVPERSEEDMRRSRAIAGEAQDQRMRESCTFCLDEGKRVGKHLLLSVGEKSYVCLPHRGALVPDHCLIVPLGHAGASTALETDVYREIVDFQRALVRMYDQQGKAAIFFETAAIGKRAKHMVIHCVPMPKRDAAVAPGYFKKTLSDTGSEWGQHRKIIDTTGKGVRRAIPKEFPYFHVQFPDGTSFGHVIEDVKGFPKDLGKEVIAGILELEPEAVRGAHESYEAQRSRAQAFQRTWRPYDPTRAQRAPTTPVSSASSSSTSSSGQPPA